MAGSYPPSRRHLRRPEQQYTSAPLLCSSSRQARFAFVRPRKPGSGASLFVGRAAVELLKLVREALVERFEDVSVDVHRDTDVGVSESLLYELRVCAKADHHRRARVPEVVEPE